MTDTTPTTPDLNWDALVAERAALKATAEQAVARIKDIDAELVTLGYGTHPCAGLKVTIGHNRTLDRDAFTAAYPVKDHPALYKVTVTPDLDAVKQNIAPAALDAFYREGAPKVVVK